MDAPSAPPLADMDPDYENPGAEIKKRQKVMELDAKHSCVKKIVGILTKQFAHAVEAKQREALEVDRRLNDARDTIDSLRACIVAKYYSSPSAEPSSYSRNQQQLPRPIHPAVKQLCGKKPSDADKSLSAAASQPDSTPAEAGNAVAFIAGNAAASHLIAGPRQNTGDTLPVCRGSVPPAVAPNGRVTKRLIVGNISKYIPDDRRDEKDMATHKWMVYVRGPREQPDVSHFVRKVWFFLHPSYKPNDLVEVSQPPFHLTKRGWGEFPVRVQVHLNDARGGKVDIIHHLKLDRTYTGLQTLGAETHVDVEIDVAVKVAAELLPHPILPMAPVTGAVAQERLSPPASCSDEQLSASLVCVKKEPTSPPDLHAVANGASSEGESIQAPATSCVLLGTTQQRRYVSLLATSTVNSCARVVTAPKAETTVNPGRGLDAMSAVPMECSDLTQEAANPDLQDVPPASRCGSRPSSAFPAVFVKCQDRFGRYYFIRSDIRKATNAPNGVRCPADDIRAIGNGCGPAVKLLETAASRSNGSVSSCSLVSAHRVQSADERLRQVIGTLKTTNLASMDVLINCLIKHCPLIVNERVSFGCAPGTAASRDETPYCAPSLEAFLSWPLGKRRASEWLRAREIRKLAAEVLGGSSPTLRGEHLWSTKRIFQWCRMHLYSPENSSLAASVAAGDALVLPAPHAEVTCTSSVALLSDIAAEAAVYENIDVDGVELKAERSQHVKAKRSSVFTNFNRDDDCSLTAEHKFIRSLSAGLGLHFSSAVVPYSNHDTHKESVGGSDATDSTATAATCEAALYGIMLAFGEELLRRAASATQQRGSVEVTVSDVITAIQTCELFDFLSDKYMGE